MSSDEYRIKIRDTTKKEKRSERIGTGISTGIIGAATGAALHPEAYKPRPRMGKVGAAAAVGGVVGAGIGAAIPPSKQRAELVPKKHNKQAVMKSAFGVDHDVEKAFGMPEIKAGLGAVKEFAGGARGGIRGAAPTAPSAAAGLGHNAGSMARTGSFKALDAMKARPKTSLAIGGGIAAGGGFMAGKKKY